jgi:hypothetical protein
MATGDVTLSVAVTGGVTKTVTLASAIRTKAKLGATTDTLDLSTDAAWQVHVVNKMASSVVSVANGQLESEATWTPATYTKAT